MKFKQWLFQEKKNRTGTNAFYPPLYYCGQYPEQDHITHNAQYITFREMRPGNFKWKHFDKTVYSIDNPVGPHSPNNLGNYCFGHGDEGDGGDG